MIMERIWLRLRQLELAQRQPNWKSDLKDGLRWHLQAMQLQTDITDFLLRLK